MKHAARSATLWAICLYQRFLSPLKGFACAYRVHTGRRSCSQLGYRAVRRFGVWGGLGVLDTRLALCADCHAERVAISARRRAQLGSCDAPCDLPCDGCDGPSVCDCLDCGDCDRRRKDKRPTRQERQEARRRIREQRQRADVQYSG